MLLYLVDNLVPHLSYRLAIFSGSFARRPEEPQDFVQQVFGVKPVANLVERLIHSRPRMINVLLEFP